MQMSFTTNSIVIAAIQQQNARKPVGPAQVAIQYVVAKGGVPLVDVYDNESAQDLLSCLGWELTQDEISMLDNAVDLVQS